ncbi:MAG: hypothetical protein ACKOJB_09665, partial [Chthoniobacterales bacterium]
EGRERGLVAGRLVVVAGEKDVVFIFAPRSCKDVTRHGDERAPTRRCFCRDYRQPAEPPREAGKIVVASSQTTPGWRAFIAVPRDVLAQSRGENEYDIFFARYDYESAGDKPALSSFPVQRGDKPDFHRRGDYAILRLTP